MEYNYSQATCGGGPPSVDTNLRPTMYEQVPQDDCTNPHGASPMTQAPNSLSQTHTGQSQRKRRIKNPCDPCKSRKTKCDGVKPCNSCETKGRECTFTYRYKGQAFRTGPDPPSSTEMLPGFKSSGSLTEEQLRHFNGVTLNVPDNFGKWAAEFGRGSWPPPAPQTAFAHEQSSAAPATQQVPPELEPWPPGAAHQAGAASGTWRSSGHEYQTELAPLRYMCGKDGYPAIPPGPGPSLPNTDTLPSIGSLYQDPQMDRTENANDVRR